MSEGPSPMYALTDMVLATVKSMVDRSLSAADASADPLDADTVNTANISAPATNHGETNLPRFQVGDFVNSRYEVLQTLGAGGMGVVYRVRDHLFPGRRVALKTLQQVTNPEMLALFQAEFRALAELRHPNIAEVYEFEELAVQVGYLFTMELVEGQDLNAAMRSRDVTLVWRAVTEMAEALAYVHSHGMLHLDIKPSNAILSADGICKLLDFGLVGLVFTPGQIAGTPVYMAPELLKDQAPDVRSDLFSLGITAYHLLTGTVPYSCTTHLQSLIAEKLERVVEFPAEHYSRIPAFMRHAVARLCALQPQERFASAQEFLDATRDEASTYGIVASRAAHRVVRSSFVGREQELKQVLDFVHKRMTAESPQPSALLCSVSAPSGMGKSRLLAEARTLLQSDGYTFLQGDAYDQDVGEYTALAPILLAASHLAHAKEALALIHQHGPELVKIVPGFGLPIVCEPSPAFSNGEAERDRLIASAAAFLLELAQHRAFTVYLNDLQWAGEGTIYVLRQLLKELRTHPSVPLALMISYRNNEVLGRPVERLLKELPTLEIEHVQLQGLSAEQVSVMMASMLLATVSKEIARQLQQATEGVPFLVEESTRWLLSQGTLAVRNGACVVNTEADMLDLHVEVSKGIVARAALQGEEALRCLKLLTICARPIAIEHLRHAMVGMNVAHQEIRGKQPNLDPVLFALEGEQLVVPVAGKQARYALAHDRIREALFASISADEGSQLHGSLGAAFEAFLLATNADELAVLAAVHQNATPVPLDLAARLRRCDVNLRAAEVEYQAADFTQALTFLDAAETLLAPNVWTDQARGMRLTYQRALTFGAMLRPSECIDFAQQAIRHAQSLIEEGRALVLAVRALVSLSRFDEAIDASLDFINRLYPQAKLPKNPGLLSVAGDVIAITRLVQRVGGQGILSRLNEPEDPKRDLLYQIITDIGDAAYFARPMLVTRIARFGLECLIREGASLSSRSSGWIGVIVMSGVALGAAGKIDLTIEMCKVARQLIDSVSLEKKGKFLLTIAAFQINYDHPLRAATSMFLTADSHCRQARDTAYQGYSLMNLALVPDWHGEPLDRVNTAYQKLGSEPTIASSQEIKTWIRILQRRRAALQGQGESAGQNSVGAALSKTSKAFQCATKLQATAFGVRPGACRAGEYGFASILSLSLGNGSSFSEVIAHFYAGLVYLTALRGKLSLLDRLHFKAAAEFVTSNIRKRARYNPVDFSHRIALLDAEHLRNQRKLKSAVPLYENAARLAQENGWLNEAALVLEKFTEVLIELGELERARAAVKESIMLYQGWQAWAKVEQMERVAATLGNRNQ